MMAFLDKLFSRSPKDPRHAQGAWGERVAARTLKGKGHRILGKRVRLSRRDELDLVTRDGETLVFVEVKTRRNEDFMRASAAIDRGKRHALSRAAVRYLKRLRQQPDYFRFDVVEVIGERESGEPTVRHTEHAFTLDKQYRLPG